MFNLIIWLTIKIFYLPLYIKLGLIKNFVTNVKSLLRVVSINFLKIRKDHRNYSKLKEIF